MDPLTTSGDDLVITGDQLSDLLSFSAVFTVMEDAVQNLEFSFTDDDIAAFGLMPQDFRVRISARLLELAGMMRESLRELDGRIFQLGPQAV